MIVKTYGLYDGKAKEFVSTFTSRNDETAERSAKYIVREKGFDKIAGRDYIIQHVFDFDSATGLITDNSVRAVCNLNDAINEFEDELKGVNQDASSN